jgi:hypothetical protein
MYIEQRYCDDCMTVHWVEILPTGRQVCHGADLWPAETDQHYTRRLGHGYELIEKRAARPTSREASLIQLHSH